MEFERYKQDCRKRALDLAIDEFKSQLLYVNNHGENVGSKFALNFAMDTTQKAMVPLADKYYNWLISIPE